MAEPKKFTSKRKTIPVEVEDENGVSHSYTLRELSGTLRDKYLNRMRQRSAPGAGEGAGFAQFKNYEGFVADLLCLSLFDADGKAVDGKVIQEWGSATQMELFKMAQEMSGLGKAAVEEAKNDLPESDLSGIS